MSRPHLVVCNMTFYGSEHSSHILCHEQEGPRASAQPIRNSMYPTIIVMNCNTDHVSLNLVLGDGECGNLSILLQGNCIRESIRYAVSGNTVSKHLSSLHYGSSSLVQASQ